MAGLSTDGGRSRRRNVNTEINMIPMIDLFMVTISFLLLTSAWTHGNTLPSSVAQGGNSRAAGIEQQEAKLHVDMRREGVVHLAWRRGPTIVEEADTSRNDLGAAVARSWKSHGSHVAFADRERDRAVLHVNNDTSFDEMTRVLDVIGAPIRMTPRGNTHAFVATISDD